MAAKTGHKGLELEETLKAYFWQAGYFAVRGVPFRIDDEDITDVDLWLYERPAALTRRRLIVDAKNKKVPRAAERLVWARGLQSALGVDGAMVASTDKRASSRRLAKRMGVTLLDGDAVAKLSATSKLGANELFSLEDYDGLFKAVDESRRSAEWRTALIGVRAALLTNFGIHSANMALRVAGFFADQTILASPQSFQAEAGLRGFYSASAYAAIGLDYVLADLAFRSADERKAALISAIRYGHPDTNEALAPIRAAVNLVRQHASNGHAIAKQVERGFEEQASKVQSEIIAEYMARVSSGDAIFAVARELERNAFKKVITTFDGLSVDARSFLGVVLDFLDLPREKLANAVAGSSPASAPALTSVSSESEPSSETGQLFPDSTGKL